VLFNSVSYLLFLPVAVTLFWLFPHRLRAPFLLVASLYFYMSWVPIYGLLIAFLTVVNYGFGVAIAKANLISGESKFKSGEGADGGRVAGSVTGHDAGRVAEGDGSRDVGAVAGRDAGGRVAGSVAARDAERGRELPRHWQKNFAKPWLILAIVTNLATLFYFKYTDFLIAGYNNLVAKCAPLLAMPTEQMQLPLMHVLLPLGISFFVFEFIHYVTDVYKGSMPIKNFVHFSLFAAFFPSQIAGPIKRYQDFVKQLEVPRSFEAGRLERGLQLILQGLFKKVAIADNLANIAGLGFSNAASLGSFEAFVAAMAFTIQIYCDFSGYTDMGRGSAIMMGFDLPDNFNWPYLARDLSDFWRRWHISLSSWLRDYLYIPLGGSRCSLSRRHFNLLATMVLGGLWHGAAWHFVVWGAFHGLGLVFNHTYAAFVKEGAGSFAGALRRFHGTTPGVLLSALFTFAFVVVGWVFFRAQNLTEALGLLRAMTSFASSSVLVDAYGKYPGFIALSVYLGYRFVCYGGVSRVKGILAHVGGGAGAAVDVDDDDVGVWARLLLPARVVAYLCFFFAAVGLSPMGESPFIYFQF
jgi:alginate O-acetyltransferase complex protein AlgI